MLGEKQLYKSKNNKIIAGVAGGIAEYLEIDPIIIRILFIILAFINGSGILLYILLMIIMPEKLSESGKTSEEVPHSSKEGKSTQAPKTKEGKERKNTLNLIGILIVLVGVVLLIKQLFPSLFFIRWDIVWSIALIGIGILLIYKSTRQ